MRAALGLPFGSAVTFLLSIFLVGGMLGPLAIADAVRISTFANLSITLVDDLPSGGLVKVSGVVVSSNGIAWGGREHESRDGFSWAWDTDAAFRIQDPSGEVNVTTHRWWAVEGTVHPALNSPHGLGSVYLAGDSILVVGEVAGSGLDTYLEVLYASPDIFRLDPLTPFLAGTAFLTPFIVVGAALVRLQHRRGSIHDRKVRSFNATTDMEDVGGRAEHRHFPQAGGRVAWAGPAVAVVMGGTCTILVWGLATSISPHTRREFYVFDLLVGVILAAGVIFSTAAFSFGRNRTILPTRGVD